MFTFRTSFKNQPFLANDVNASARSNVCLFIFNEWTLKNIKNSLYPIQSTAHGISKLRGLM